MGSPKWSRRVLVLMMLLKTFTSIWATEVCSNTILPGSKGDQGERGDEGDQGRLGKAGPPGQRGSRGELGSQGDLGQMGKVGPAGEKGVKGLQGAHGPSGLKGKSGSTCDCGRYRKVVGQLDINISKLKNAVKFLKNGIQETEEKFYLIVKEARKFKEAQMNCKLRGGALATPETEDTNSLIAKYVAQAGLTHVFIGQRVQGQEGADLGVSHPQNYTAWAPGEPREPTTKDGCVQMSSTGAWSQSECDATMYYVCEFLKRKRGPLSVQ